MVRVATCHRGLLGLLALVSVSCSGGSGESSHSTDSATDHARASGITASDIPDDVAAEDWLSLVRGRIEASQYQFFPRERGFFADNGPQGVSAHLDAGGVRLALREQREVEATLRLTGFGRGASIASVPNVEPRLGRCNNRTRLDEYGDCLRRLEFALPGITESWDNRGDGLEQSWELSEKPSGSGLVRLVVSVEGATPEGAGAAGILLQFPGGGGLSYEELQAFDTAGSPLSASMRVEPGQIVIEVDDANARYPIVIDPLVTSATWFFNGLEANDQYGATVASGGDVNNDGFDDVLVGAPMYDRLATNAGRAYAYYGSATGLSTTPSWAKDGLKTDGQFGFSLAHAGDVNGDGYSDVVVGEPYSNSFTGQAMVFLGSSMGLSTQCHLCAASPFPEALFGKSVSSAGDVNGDGYSDVLIGSPSLTNGSGREGGIYLYWGSASGLDAANYWFRESGVAGLLFGGSVAGVGDVNGDGLSDFVVGALGYRDANGNDVGRVYGYLGRFGSTPGNSSWRLSGSLDPDTGADVLTGVGFSVAGVGDVNGDGYADVAVGAPYTDKPAQPGNPLVVNAGRVGIYAGSDAGFTSHEIYGDIGALRDDYVGMKIGATLDVNGDGFSDFITNVKHTSAAGAAPTGKVIFGNLNSAHDGAVAVAFPGNGAGDVNSDGLADVIIGTGLITTGMARIYTGQLVAPTPSADITSGIAADKFGSATAAVGDVNGDGFTDLVVGAPFVDDAQPGAGKALLYLGSAGGLAASPAWSTTGLQVDAHWGSALVGGDFNGDGYADVAVGAPDYDNGELGEGRVTIYLGSATGLATTAARTLESNQAGAAFGSNLASGDVNGDGFADLIVGALRYSNGQSNEGRVFVYHGSSNGIGVTASRTLENDQANSRFGISLAQGDANGDGFADLVVGADAYTSGAEPGEGRVYAYHGSASGLSAAANWGAESDRASVAFGRAVAVGDVNNDGRDDLVVGAPKYTNPEGEEGRVFLYLGSATGYAAASWFMEGNLQSGHFGATLAMGDRNNDGFADLVVGYPDFYTANGQPPVGGTRVYEGHAAGLPSLVSYALNGFSNEALGSALSFTGDFDGDGLSDMTAAFNGAVKIFSLRAKGLALQARRPGTTTPILTGGKSPSRAFDAAARAYTGRGRAKVKLVVEVKPRAIPFDGLNLRVSSTWLDSGVASDYLTLPVTGLAAATAYHWRARLQYEKTQGFSTSYSRWYYAGTPGQRNGVQVLTP